VKRLLLPFLLITSFSINAQQWAATGTKWYYTQSFWYPGYRFPKIIESVGDTLLLGIPCKILKITGSEFSQTSVYWQYMYASNDSVFFYKDSSFCLLYDFNAMPGDTFDLPCFSDPYSELRVAVINVDTVIINGIARKRQFVNGGQLGYAVWGYNIQGIGNSEDMFPQGDMAYTGPIRCFEDSGGIHNFLSIPCDTVIITQTEDAPNYIPEIFVYPNPSTNFLFLQPYTEIQNINIYDALGKLHINQNHDIEKGIDVTSLQKGIYFIEVSGKNGMKTGRFLKE